MRKEKDALGAMDLPDDALYGIHTARSLDNFGSAGEAVPLSIIYAMVRLKSACARANVALGQLEEDKGRAICTAADKVLSGAHDDQFPIDICQAGSGTSSHMNVNEVLANLACLELGGKPGDRSLVHPNDDVNKGQSTNNVFPSSIRMAATRGALEVISALEALVESLRGKEKEFEDVIKSGRTHLQDAVPITLGQEFSAYARALTKAVARIRKAREKLFELGVGGNAVGTGLNTMEIFRSRVVWELRKLTDEPYIVAVDGVEATQFLTDMAEMAAAYRLSAIDLLKITNDLRLLSSGPRTGFGEINLPPVEPGSSIMPGKINPSICEAVNMACLQVSGLDHAVSAAAAAGQLELNTHMPLVGANLVKMAEILADACRRLAEKCITGITANPEQCRRYFEQSVGLATVLNPRLGYDRVAELVKESLASGKSLRELIVDGGILTGEEWENLLKSATQPNL